MFSSSEITLDDLRCSLCSLVEYEHVNFLVSLMSQSLPITLLLAPPATDALVVATSARTAFHWLFIATENVYI